MGEILMNWLYLDIEGEKFDGSLAKRQIHPYFPVNKLRYTVYCHHCTLDKQSKLIYRSRAQNISNFIYIPVCISSISIEAVNSAKHFDLGNYFNI